MKHQLLHILPLLLVIMLTGCVTEMDDLRPNSSRGSFTLGLSTDSLAVEVETRASRDLTEAEQTMFAVSLVQNGEPVWSNIPFANITETDCTQPTGNGYVVSAENCTASEAETANDGWGQRRYWGQSATFSIRKDENTVVSVDCHMVNAGLSVQFDESFTSYFTLGYSVTTDDRRALRFDDNSGQIAYYNINEGTTHNLHLLINASAGWDGTLHIERNIDLQPGRVYRLHIRKGMSETGNVDVIITTENFVEGKSEEVIVEYDLRQAPRKRDT